MSQGKLTWQVEIDPRDDDIETLRNHLRLYNKSKVDFSGAVDLAIFVRNEAGEMMGGICAELWGAVLEIDFLWIDDSLRGQGMGKRLLLQLEEEARLRNGRIAILDTFDFQAPEFYQSLGYEVMGIVEGFGHQHRKYFLRKSLLKP